MSGNKNVTVEDQTKDIEGAEKQMSANLETFVNSYYNLLDISGGPIGDYDPRDLIEKALGDAEDRWLDSLPMDDEEDLDGEDYDDDIDDDDENYLEEDEYRGPEDDDYDDEDYDDDENYLEEDEYREDE